MALCRAVLLDVDGTLVDSNDAHARAWVKAIGSAGYAVTFERVRSLIGMGGDRLLPQLLGISVHSDEGREITRTRAETFARFLPAIKTTPGAVFLLSRLRALKVKLVVITSAGRDEVTKLLDICDMSAFVDAIVSGDDVRATKPAPDVVTSGIERSGAEPGDVVVIGDTPYDIEAAMGAHAPAIALRCGGWWSDAHLAGAAAIYDDPAALVECLDKSPLARS